MPTQELAEVSHWEFCWAGGFFPWACKKTELKTVWCYQFSVIQESAYGIGSQTTACENGIEYSWWSWGPTFQGSGPWYDARACFEEPRPVTGKCTQNLGNNFGPLRASTATNLYAAISMGGAYANIAVIGADINSFLAQIEQQKAAGLQLKKARIYLEDGQRLWAGIFHADAAQSHFVHDLSQVMFMVCHDLLFAQGWNLIYVDTYLKDGERLWAGVFTKATTGNYFIADRDLVSFEAEVEQYKQNGFHLISLKTYVSGGQRLWAGVFRAAQGINLFNANLTLEDFLHAANVRHNQEGLRLIAVESYIDEGQQLWAGTWVEGTAAAVFYPNRTREQFLKECQDFFDNQGLRLIDLIIYDDQ
jgi:hypothetical protein